MPSSLSCSFPASSTRPVAALDVFQTDAATGAPSTLVKQHALSPPAEANGTATIPLTDAQAPAGRRFAVRARNAEGSSPLSPVAVVPGGTAPALESLTTAYRDDVNARRQALNLDPLADAEVAKINEFWLRLGDRDGETGRDLAPDLIEAYVVRAAYNVGGGAVALGIKQRTTLDFLGSPAWTSSGVTFDRATNDLLRAPGPHVAGQDLWTHLCFGRSDNPSGTSAYLASQWERGPNTGVIFEQRGSGSGRNGPVGYDGASFPNIDGTWTTEDVGRVHCFSARFTGGSNYKGYVPQVGTRAERDTGTATDHDGPLGNAYALGGSSNRVSERALTGLVIGTMVFSGTLTDAEELAVYTIYRETVGAGVGLLPAA